MPLRGRLLLSGARSGAWNMALDEALLETAREDVLTLRLYGWRPATLSLGRFQRRSAVPPGLSDRFPLVRRPTGGGAIIHGTDEITLSLSGRAGFAPPTPRAAAEWICAAVQGALARFGLKPYLAAERLAGDSMPEASLREKPPMPSLFCSTIRNPLDILVQGPKGARKLLGTAQRRMGNAWLIHGGLALRRPPEASAMEGEEAGTSILESLPSAWRTGDLESTDPPALEDLRSQVLEALAPAFSAVLGMTFEVGPLEPQEAQLACLRLANRYASPAWNRRL